ncbi:thioesterase [Streptomyces tauricus]|uniref:thioesterase II family protein n=1 Tax=Streptomyces tauricus TaxID=68274 RepID=UPI0019A43408|nr:thioesterase domain-containing protein [Streptomyces tauricus]GHA05929.1 thioesterase [Streptomyces tauricus]
MHTIERSGRGPSAPRPPTAGWFPGFGPSTATPARAGAAPLRLVCLPYAGGTPSVYRNWAAHLGDPVHVVPVLLPGRGLRVREAPYTGMGALVADLTDALMEHELAHDYALFGHSMGALLAYEVAHELRDRGLAEPAHLFVSGSRAPHLYGDRRDHTLSDAELRQLVRDLGGLGADDTIGGSYLERRLPVLRADLTVCETYRWAPRRPLSCPMTAFSATRDPIAPAHEMEAWRVHTRGSLLRHHVEGDHFFLNGPSRPYLLREIRAELARHLDVPGDAGTAVRDRPPTAKREPSWIY